MAGKATYFFHYLLIIVFSAGIVAVGAQELHERFGRGGFSRGRASSGDLVRDLRGGSPPGTGEYQKARSYRKERSTSETPPESPRFQFSWQNGKSRDDLSSSDRKQLGELLSGLSGD